MSHGASEMQELVKRLNAPPFRKDLTLVEFDKLSAFELLQLLNDVLAYLEPRHKVDLRDEPQEDTASRMYSFLSILKFKFPPGVSPAQVQSSMLNGERHTIYPLLTYLLTKLPSLRKRAYLARYLVPLEVPEQYMLDNEVQAVYNEYKAVQKEFRETHQSVDKLRKNTLAPTELAQEINQLREEKRQLIDKIQELKDKAASSSHVSEFDKILPITSALRHEQEEQAKLAERMAEQQAANVQSDRHLQYMSFQLQELRKEMKKAASAQALMARAESDLDSLTKETRRKLPHEHDELQSKLQQLRRTLVEPAKTEDEVREQSIRVRRMQDDINGLRREIRESRAKNSNDGLAVYHSQAAQMAKKVEGKRDQQSRATAHGEQLRTQIEKLESEVADLGSDHPMGAKTFADTKANIMKHLAQYKQQKKELAEIQKESVVLHRTETLLKSKCQSLDKFMAQIERRRGVEGYTRTEDSLKEVTSAAEALNQTKGKTLEEISQIVTNITTRLAEKKAKLQPLIQKLREVRSEYKDIEGDYVDGKTMFENTAAGLESERVKLEQDCDSYQTECQRQESNFHLLSCMKLIAEVNMDRVRLEERFQNGDGELLPQFRTFAALYNSKIQQQQSLNQELRKQNELLKGAAPQDTQQRGYFRQLLQLLEAKADVYRRAAKIEAGLAADDEKDMAEYASYGGVNVMTLNDSSP